MAAYGAILNACPVCEIPTFENGQTWWLLQYWNMDYWCLGWWKRTELEGPWVVDGCSICGMVEPVIQPG